MLLLVDANVLIDFVSTEPQVLALAVRHLGPVQVPRDGLDEVEQLDESECARLGLVIIEGTLDQLAEAGSVRGRLSFADRMCLILARDRGLTCVTNDTRLRRECKAANVTVMWGLQVLLDLVRAGGVEVDEAITIARAVGRVNPRLAPEVVEAFERKVRRP